MSDRIDDTQDYSMDRDFSEGLAGVPDGGEQAEARGEKKREASRAKEPVKESAKPPKTKKERNVSKLKRVLIIIAAAAAVILVLVIVLVIRHRRNDGKRFAQELSAALGGTMAAAENTGSIKLHGRSENSYVNAVIPQNAYVAESLRSCRVEGVHLPEWVIVCAAEGETLSSVTYYDYEQLEKNASGKKRKSYLDPHTAPNGSDVVRAEEALGLEPYSISYRADHTQVREYRYCYKDGESKDQVCYVITATWDQNGVLTNITEARLDMISGVLAPRSAS